MGLTGNNSPTMWAVRDDYAFVGRTDGREYVYKNKGVATNGFTVFGGYSGATPYGYEKLYAPLADMTPQPQSIMHPGQVVDVLVHPGSGYYSGYEAQPTYMLFYQGSGFINSGHMLLPGERGSYEWDGQQFYKRKRLSSMFLTPLNAKAIPSTQTLTGSAAYPAEGTGVSGAISGHAYPYIKFVGTSNLVKAIWCVAMPAGWDRGNIRIIAYAYAINNSATGNVKWQYDAYALNPTDSMSGTVFTVQKSVIQNWSTNQAYRIKKSNRSEEFAVRNIDASLHPDYESPFIYIEALRNPNDTSDTNSYDVYLTGLQVEYYLDKWW